MQRKVIGLLVLSLVVTACAAETSSDTTESESTTATTAATETTTTIATADTPDAEAFSIPDTGQTTCFDDTSAIDCPEEGDEFFGQDASYEGDAMRYLDNGDGTVTDLVTGLMWQQDPGDKTTYSVAIAAEDDFDLAGYDDWRLPTITELYSLIDFSGSDSSTCVDDTNCTADPFIDDSVFAFEYGDTSAGERLIDSQWMSSTVYEGLTMGGNETVFGVNFADGRIKGYPISDPQGGEKTFFVIYVRDNPDYDSDEYVDNGDGTVTDLTTGLMWQQADSGVGMDWSEALDHCEALDLAGYDDWTLPDAKQLQYLVDYTRSPSATGSAAIDPVFETTAITTEDGESDWGSYWSGTTHESTMNAAWGAYVSFGEALGWWQGSLDDVHGAGAQRSDPKSGDASEYPDGHGPQGDVVRVDNLVRCVRSDAGTVTGTPAPAETATEAAPTGGPLAEAAATLGVTEDALAAALGDPSEGPPDFEAAAAILGVSVEDLMNAVGPPPG